jgi:hypothetical protein
MLRISSVVEVLPQERALSAFSIAEQEDGHRWAFIHSSVG